MNVAQLLKNQNARREIYPDLDPELSFSDYITACKSYIQAKRPDLQQDFYEHILEANAPFELYPMSHTHSAGVLLIHGLFDSPFTMHDIGSYLQSQHIPSKAILLPGHGTVTDDLLQVTQQNWIDAVQYGITALKKEVEQVYLIGYSTGAILSLYHAFQNKEIAGVILIAPVIKMKKIADILINCNRVFSLLNKPNNLIYQEPELDYVRYQSFHFHPIAQVHRLTQEIDQLRKQKLTCPILTIMSERDETVSAAAAIKFFKQQNHPDNILWLYSAKTNRKSLKNIILRPSSYPEKNIYSISHLAMLYSPENAHYGEQGDYIYASKPDKIHRDGAYNRITVQLNNWAYERGLCTHKIRTLTYNPDFEEMAKAICGFIKNNKR